MIYLDVISTIQDPEKPCTLEYLDVVQEDLISVKRGGKLVHLTPTWCIILDYALLNSLNNPWLYRKR